MRAGPRRVAAGVGDAEEGGGNLGCGKRERKREAKLRRPGRKAGVLALEKARMEART